MCSEVQFIIPQSMRLDFANPRGVIVKGELKAIIDSLEWKSVTCVGDVVSRYCLRSARLPDVIIYDGISKRSKTLESLDDLVKGGFTRVEIDNPPGGLTLTSVETVCRAILASVLSGSRTAIKINGEEDMLALPALACSPNKSLVIYGIPDKGAALVRISNAIRKEAQNRLLRLVPYVSSLK